MPLELWVQAAKHQLRVREMPVPLIYLDEERSFGGTLDAADLRLKYYREVIQRAIVKADFRLEAARDEPAADAEAMPCS